MPDVVVYGGPLKRDLIKRAYGLCGQSVTEYELTPEAYDLALQAMISIAPEFGRMPFNLPAYGPGSADDESGLPYADVQGFITRLAQEIAPNIGKSFSPNGPQARALSILTGKYQCIPHRQLGRQTPTGAGNRPWGGFRPFFPVCERKTYCSLEEIPGYNPVNPPVYTPDGLYRLEDGTGYILCEDGSYMLLE